MNEAMRDKMRMKEWLLITILGLILMAVFEPQQLILYLWFTVKVSGAAYLGYWMDRTLFRGHRLDSGEVVTTVLVPFLYLRRAIIVGSCVVAMGVSV